MFGSRNLFSHKVDVALECTSKPASSSGASFFAWQRRAWNELINRKGPREGYRRQAKRRVARCLLPTFLCAHVLKRRRLGTRLHLNEFGYFVLHASTFRRSHTTIQSCSLTETACFLYLLQGGLKLSPHKPGNK